MPIDTQAMPPADGGSQDADLDLSKIPDTIPTEDVGALKRAYERQKQIVAEQSKTNESLSQKAAILDRLTQQGVDPATIPALLAELKEQQNAADTAAKLRAELEFAHAAKLKTTTEGYEIQLTALDNYVRVRANEQTLDGIFLEGGGVASNALEMQQFRNLVAMFVDLESAPIKQGDTVVGYRAEIKTIKQPDGTPYFVPDSSKMNSQSRPATMADLLTAIKKGDYGRSLQVMLPAYNQSSGAGISVAGGRIGGKAVLSSGNIGSQLASMTPEQLAAVRKSGAVLTDR